MKPDWDKLMLKYSGHEDILVAGVDCTSDGASLCTRFEISGYPILKSGDPDDLQEYKGHRVFEAFDEHARKLRPPCSPQYEHKCTGEQAKLIKHLKALGHEGREALIADVNAERMAADRDFVEFEESLGEDYQAATAKKHDKVLEVKGNGTDSLAMLKMCHIYQKQQEDKKRQEEKEADEAKRKEEKAAKANKKKKQSKKKEL
eukprot:gnl/TRDRNA2_/TRDRNA2_43466_c0_seq1.p1 gnl/TRDRNA2_/TRDRNA2_43466_c0~~gnl/TRDRNA2_/TRDRNA2_43466_c0_seq1.p1  ORF type:complete len:203 (+),score=63.88 gnl/TRDRNA2_/TRDRNA2_43466_c0_seq1:238-846(+)